MGIINEFRALVLEEIIELIWLRNCQLVAHRKHSTTAVLGLFSIFKHLKISHRDLDSQLVLKIHWACLAIM